MSPLSHQVNMCVADDSHVSDNRSSSGVSSFPGNPCKPFHRGTALMLNYQFEPWSIVLAGPSTFYQSCWVFHPPSRKTLGYCFLLGLVAFMEVAPSQGLYIGLSTLYTSVLDFPSSQLSIQRYHSIMVVFQPFLDVTSKPENECRNTE